MKEINRQILVSVSAVLAVFGLVAQALPAQAAEVGELIRN